MPTSKKRNRENQEEKGEEQADNSNNDNGSSEVQGSIVEEEEGKNLSKSRKKVKTNPTTSNEEIINSETESSNYPDLPIVCNVKVSFIRPNYQNLKEWMEDSQRNVYIGRQGVIFINGRRFPSQPSKWANPYKLNKDGNRTQVCERFYEEMKEKLKNNPQLVDELKELKGKCIGCWCVENPTSSDKPPIVCHGQMIIRLMKEFCY